MKKILSIALFLLSISAIAQNARPSRAQVEWQQMEMNMFCHFGPNTFTGNEWGNGKESVSLFNPTEMDCRQWARVAKAAGFKGIIITAKHHDGFCLWPSRESTHTVRESPWKDGKGDVLKELSDACREQGLKFGVYVSPWDRNAPTYGTPEYNDVFARTLQEVHTQYGDVFEQWFDGACGEGPNGKKQIYDFPRFNKTVLDIHPDAVIFSDIGPGCRWMGNESGVNGKTCWSTLDLIAPDGHHYGPGAAAPPQPVLNEGNEGAAWWIPAETDVSIRPGWFWRESEHPKSLQELLSIYYTSIGRNSLLLLNVPPDNRGLIDAEDSLRLTEFRSALDKIFANELAKKAQVSTASVLEPGRYSNYNPQNREQTKLFFRKPVTFNRIVLQEDITYGQNVASFRILIRKKGDKETTLVTTGTTIGHKRIVLLPMQKDVQEIVVDLILCREKPHLLPVQLYRDDIFDDTKLLETTIHRTTDGLE